MVWAGTGDSPDRIEKLVLESGHPLIEHDLLEERHEDDLAAALSSVAGLLLLVVPLSLIANLHDQDHRDPLLFGFRDRVAAEGAEPGVYLGLVGLLFTVRDSDVGIVNCGWFGPEGWRTPASRSNIFSELPTCFHHRPPGHPR